MIATVMGKFSKPYDVDGNKGVSYRVSLFAGEYQSDSLTGSVGEGEQFIEVKCPLSVFEKIDINGEYSFDLDDGKTKIKDALIKRGDGSFVPLVWGADMALILFAIGVIAGIELGRAFSFWKWWYYGRKSWY